MSSLKLNLTIMTVLFALVGAISMTGCGGDDKKAEVTEEDRSKPGDEVQEKLAEAEAEADEMKAIIQRYEAENAQRQALEMQRLRQEAAAREQQEEEEAAAAEAAAAEPYIDHT